jgi:hypothetical protein
MLTRFARLWLPIVITAFHSACSGDVVPQPPKASATEVIPIPVGYPTNDESAAALLGRLQPTIGAPPAECGRHFLMRTSRGFSAARAGELDLSLNCGMAAAKAFRPFWTFKQEHGIDSWVAHGLIGSSDGTIQRFWYDSAPCGGPGCEARLAVTPCKRPSVRTTPDGRAEFVCGPNALSGI